MKAPAVFPGIVIAAIAIAAGGASATEFYIGEPLTRNGLQIVPAYLLGVEMEPMPKHSAMGADAVHLEADIHALGDETHGFAEDGWIPYLTISYTIEKVGSSFKKSGQLLPMIAKDGPHYANNIEMAGRASTGCPIPWSHRQRPASFDMWTPPPACPNGGSHSASTGPLPTPVNQRKADTDADLLAGASVV